MSNLGGGEIFAVLLLALIVLGPERLPEAARKVGDFVRQVRTMSSGFQEEVRKAVDLGDVPFHPEEARLPPLTVEATATEDTEPADNQSDESKSVDAASDAMETDIRGANKSDGVDGGTTAEIAP